MDHPVPWHAVYTKSRSEKKLSERLNDKGIEAYLPLRKTLKQWSDRKKWVTEPLIPSYVFVNVDPRDYQDVLNTPGAVRYIWFGGKPAVIPERQIQILKMLTGLEIPVESCAGVIPVGTAVRIEYGPLRGLEGELVSHAGHNKVVVRIDHVETALLVTIGPEMLVTGH